MIKRSTVLFLYFLLYFYFNAASQTNKFSGSWVATINIPSKATTELTLIIGNGEKNLLFPAQLIIKTGDSTNEYDLLLAKKNTRQLAISKNKFPLQNENQSEEKVEFFNGTLDLSNDLKGLSSLHLIPKKIIDKKNKRIVDLNSFDEIRFIKINDSAWSDGNFDKILQPAVSPLYFGLTDTFSVKTTNGNFSIKSLQKNDIVTATLNGNKIIDLLLLTKKEHKEDIQLDTGMNVLLLFADNPENGFAGKGKMELHFNNHTILLDFSKRADSGAIFIAVKIYCDPENKRNNFFKEFAPDAPSQPGQHNKILGSIIATSQQVKLAVWDDAVEDGDSISINVNGSWIARGMPVKKAPQFITIHLKPGTNNINFVADNLGSIPPNTAVLEIIDGKKRKSFSLETIPGDNNFVRILYEAGGN